LSFIVGFDIAAACFRFLVVSAVDLFYLFAKDADKFGDDRVLTFGLVFIIEK
jgi:hypothetical protein